MNCAACHAVEYAFVGPSLVEVARLYRDDVEGFVKWCLQPGKKREGAIDMPSMAHLGEPALRELHGFILAQAAGKSERPPPPELVADRFPDFERRPQVQRMFLPDASPAAIAVALPGDLSFCWDAAECRLRYVWRGGFMDGWPYWARNGKAYGERLGEVIYREEAGPLAAGEKAEFLGYRMKDGLPTFRYRIDGVLVEERLEPGSAGEIVRTLRMDEGGPPVDLPGWEKMPTPDETTIVLRRSWK